MSRVMTPVINACNMVDVVPVGANKSNHKSFRIDLQVKYFGLCSIFLVGKLGSFT
uniref:Uncharacterized protein n=1 Tax=Anguilla anguilla TaxID=7936 RepID=A0A0E9T2A5_ANGAN